MAVDAKTMLDLELRRKMKAIKADPDLDAEEKEAQLRLVQAMLTEHQRRNTSGSI